MKNTLMIAPWIVIISILIYFTQCKKQEICPETNDTTITVVTVDTVKIQGKTVYKPITYQVIDTFIYMQNVDTAKILSEYLKLRKYNLPISNDTNSKINVFADVQFNRIEKWTYEAEFYPHTTVIEKNHVLIPEKRNSAVFGLILSGNKTVLGATPVFGLKTKKENIFLAGYDVINKTYQAGYLMKIGRK
jgi:hypothetical protein